MDDCHCVEVMYITLVSEYLFSFPSCVYCQGVPGVACEGWPANMSEGLDRDDFIIYDE